MSQVTSYWKSLPSVTWLSIRKSGFQVLKSLSQARISGVSALMVSRFRFRRCALLRRPVDPGPFWLGRWYGLKDSWPSTLNTGMITKIMRSSQAAYLLPTTMSRTSMREGSLPSISPAWMPLWMSITTLPVLAAAGGVKARSLDTTSAIIRRGLVPIGLLAGGQERGRRCLGAGGERSGGLGGGRLICGMRCNRVLRPEECSGHGVKDCGADHVRVC